MRRPFPPGFYGILSDPVLGYERLAALMVAEGVRCVQLRAKEAERADLLRVARAVRALIPAGHLFIVNDDPLLALEVGADGVHLGQDDCSVAQARSLLGPEALIGISTHDLHQVRQACALGADYLGAGPVFPTTTKLRPDPVLGVAGLAAMAAASSLPVVAIGGIDLERVPAVLAAGVRSLAAVGVVNRSSDPAPALRALVESMA